MGLLHNKNTFTTFLYNYVLIPRNLRQLSKRLI